MSAFNHDTTIQYIHMYVCKRKWASEYMTIKTNVFFSFSLKIVNFPIMAVRMPRSSFEIKEKKNRKHFIVIFLDCRNDKIFENHFISFNAGWHLFFFFLYNFLINQQQKQNLNLDKNILRTNTISFSCLFLYIQLIKQQQNVNK